MKEFFTLLSMKFGNRGTARKKMKFLNWYLPQVQKLGYQVDVVSGKGDFSRICNVMIGDWKHAKHVLVVPYDTPVLTIAPISYYPFDHEKNQKLVFRCMMGQLVVSILLAIFSLSIFYYALKLTSSLDYFIMVLGGVLFAISIFLGKGLANRNNFNRNNAALSIFTQILNEMPKQTAFIMMDSASGSLKGYGLLQETYGKKLKHAKAVVLDCVGIGDELVVASNQPCFQDGKQSIWMPLMKESAEIHELFSSLMIISRGSREGDALKVVNTSTYRDREVDFLQMQEAMELTKELLDIPNAKGTDC